LNNDDKCRILIIDTWNINSALITAAQMRASRAMLGIDQRTLAELAGLSLPTIQRMEASDGVVRGNVDSLMKLVGALQQAGIELIAEGTVSSQGGRGVRLTTPTPIHHRPRRR
jgi:transcriptional regulator with XRE-family HTH domain